MITKYCLLLLLLCTTFWSYDQTYLDKKFYLIDSLQQTDISENEQKILQKYLSIYHKKTQQLAKFTALYQLTENLTDDNLWPKYSKHLIQSIDTYLKHNSVKNKQDYLMIYADALNDIGVILNQLGHSNDAFPYFSKSVPIYQKYANEKALAYSYNNIGNCYQNNGNISRAISYYFKALKIQEKINDKEGKAITYSNLGVIYDHLKDLEKAKEYYKKSIIIQKQIGDFSGLGTSYNNLGFVYNYENDIKKSKYYYNLAYKIYLKLNDMDGISTSLSNIASIYQQEKNYSQSIAFFEKSLAYDLKSSNLNGIAFTHSSLGDIYFQLGDIQKAKKYGLNSLQISQKLGLPLVIKKASELLLKIYDQEQNWSKAYQMQKLYYIMKDSINNNELQKKSIRLSLNHEFEQEKAINKKENEKKLAIAKEKEENQKLISFFSFCILFIVLISLVLLFNRFKLIRKQKTEIEQQKHLVEEKNKEILDSITYAKRIQSAILPPEKFVKEYFNNSFILYKPKDIVAGDFYWFEVIENTIFFAAADCTGHGVPGAMVSVVCHNALNRSVKEYRLKTPGEILDKTREIVIAEFEKSDEDVKDGMDISLAALRFRTEKENVNEEASPSFYAPELLWSGAHNPLWALRDNEIIEYKADKQPIGKYSNAKAFTTHQIELKQNDEIYLFTDGFQDQFGGEKGKKFKASQMRELFLSLNTTSMVEKKEIIDDSFEKWKGKLEQVDDVCVIGVRI